MRDPLLLAAKRAARSNGQYSEKAGRICLERTKVVFETNAIIGGRTVITANERRKSRAIIGIPGPT